MIKHLYFPIKKGKTRIIALSQILLQNGIRSHSSSPKECCIKLTLQSCSNKLAASETKNKVIFRTYYPAALTSCAPAVMDAPIRNNSTILPGVSGLVVLASSASQTSITKSYSIHMTTPHSSHASLLLISNKI